MKNLIEKQASQKRLSTIFLIIGLIGVVACFLPWIQDISVQDGGGALVAFGGLFALIGLLSSRSLHNRAKVLESMGSGAGILSRWTYDAPQDQALRADLGEVVIGSEGVYVGGELYTFNVFSCRLESATMVNANPPEILFVLSVPHKHGRHRKELNIPVPAGFESSAAAVVQTLNATRK
jgi:hypothetical protein